jgi:putative ABC transport system permease protein
LLLEWTVERKERQFLLADLDEEFQERVDNEGPSAARRWYRSQAMRSAAPSVLRRWRRQRVRQPVVSRAGVWSGLEQDFRYSVRRIVSTPVYTSVVFFTLMLGIGALAAVLAVVNGVLIESLPFPDPEELVLVNEVDQEQGGANSWVSPPNFLDWRDQANGFIEVAAMSPNNVVLTSDGRRERVDGLVVSSNFLDVLRVAPGDGRLFTLADELEGAEAVVVVSHGFWLRHFGNTPFVSGASLLLDDVVHRVVGVLPEGFRYIQPVDVWLPLRFGPDDRTDGMRGARYLGVLGRVSSELSVSVASERFANLADELQMHPNNRGWGVALTPLRDSVVRDVRLAILLLFGAVVFILLIVCANVAALVMSRATAAWREIALRTALGATRTQIFRQVAVEHVLLALAGAAAGATLASLSLGTLLQLIPNPLPPHADVTVGGTTVAVVFLVALVTALVLSGASMVAVTRLSPSQFLRSSESAGQSRAALVLRNGLIVGEIAFSIVLLIGAMLMVQSFVRLRAVDLGFVPDRVFTTHISLPSSRYDTQEDKALFASNLTELLSQQHGVQLVALTTNLPMSGSSMRFGYHADGTMDNSTERLSAQYHAASRDYFSAVGIPFLSGGTFAAEREGPPTVIVNETLANRVWGAGSPVGRRLTVVSQTGPVSREVVGVIADVRHADPTADAPEEVYVPFGQDPWAFFTVVIKSEVGVPTTAVTNLIGSAVSMVDPGLPPSGATRLADLVSRWSAPLRFQMTMVGTFAIMALGLAAIGIYGVIAYFVGSRAREIGIRIAVGAGKADILGLVVLRSLGVAMVGIVLGLVLAAFVTRVLSSFLFEVSPHDVNTYALISFVMLGVAALASLLPTTRAARLDPVDALRVS